MQETIVKNSKKIYMFSTMIFIFSIILALYNYKRGHRLSTTTFDIQYFLKENENEIKNNIYDDKVKMDVQKGDVQIDGIQIYNDTYMKGIQYIRIDDKLIVRCDKKQYLKVFNIKSYNPNLEIVNDMLTELKNKGSLKYGKVIMTNNEINVFSDGDVKGKRDEYDNLDDIYNKLLL